jgi:hypothetical protein
MSHKERQLITRQKIEHCVRLKKENNNITTREMRTKLSISPQVAIMVFRAANAWIEKEQVDALVDQLNTGNLDGLEPLASLDDCRSDWP